MRDQSECPSEVELRDKDEVFSYPIDPIEKVEIHPTYEKTEGIVYFDGGRAEITQEDLLLIIQCTRVPIEPRFIFDIWLMYAPNAPPIEVLIKRLKAEAEAGKSNQSH